MEPLLILDAKGQIQECNNAAMDCLPLKQGMSLLEIAQEKSVLLKALHNSVDQEHPEVIELLTLVIDDVKILTRAQIAYMNNPASPNEPFFIICLNQNSPELESLEIAAKLNDQRVEKLRDNLTIVTKQLLEKTLQLAEQKNKVSTIINGMGEGLIGCDDNGAIIHINQAALSLFNLSEETVIGALFADYFSALTKFIEYHPGDSMLVEQKLFDVCSNGKDLRISVSPIFDEDEQRNDGFVLIVQDRTEQAELDRMRLDLISIVSHELRSPLTSIKGYLDLMISGDLGVFPQEMKSYIDIISSNTNRLATLIDDMLDLSRIESGKLNMSFGKVEVKYLCDLVFLTMKPQAEKKKLKFSLDVEEGLAISGDIDRMQQALTNLVSNAIKYTPEEGSVIIYANRTNEFIVIAVKDSGFGISKDNQMRLFQKFFRIKNEKTRNIGGTGLGLCITKSIVEAHDGKIIVDSKEEQGSNFIIEIPAYHS